MGKHHTDQRDRTLTLARILYNETDEFHPLPMTGLMERLEKAGVPSERKSIYRDMEALRRHGLEVEYRPGREGGWYLTGRAFERTELRQLIDPELADHTSHRCDPIIILSCAQSGDAVLLGVHPHRREFDDFEHLSVLSQSILFVEGRPSILSHQDSNDQQHGAGYDQCN